MIKKIDYILLSEYARKLNVEKILNTIGCGRSWKPKREYLNWSGKGMLLFKTNGV